MNGEKAWLDICIVKCPNCGRLYVDASWYVVEMESDVECGECGITFNTRRNVICRAMLEFDVENRLISKVKVAEYIPVEEE